MTIKQYKNTYAKYKKYYKEYRAWKKRVRPWMSSYRNAKSRCENKSYVSYNRYGGRGIKFMLTEEEIKKLWFRDKAYLLKRPSIDRIDNDGNYKYNNCRFIEKYDNRKKSSFGCI
jgi:hypothetical protein